MGCSFSSSDSNDNGPRIFKVFNVDDQGQELRAGRIQITDNDLILHQRGKEPITWPLRSLRRYGFDAELFSFESGRRCPTGPGIYAFKCRRAEALFNLLQECIQKAGQEEQQRPTLSDSGSRPNSLIALQHPNGDLSPSLQFHSVHSPQHQYVNGDIAMENGSNSRHDSLASTRAHEYVNTPVALGSSHEQRLPLDVSSIHVVVRNPSVSSEGHVINYAVLDLPRSREDVNTDIRAAVVIGHSNGNAVEVVELDPVSSQATYVNVPTSDGKTVSDSAVVGATGGVPDHRTTARHSALVRQASKEDGHSYANLDFLSTKTPPVTKFREPRTRKMNYIQLDLKNSNDNIASGPNQVPASPISLTSSNPDSPSKKTESYATIDFHKTAALSNSAQRSNNEDEGFRKTRHNSNIEELN